MIDIRVKRINSLCMLHELILVYISLRTLIIYCNDILYIYIYYDMDKAILYNDNACSYRSCKVYVNLRNL